jgi:DNA-binding protein YbaB
MDADEARLIELDKFVHESERSMRELEQAIKGMRGLYGTGESRTGAVSARVDAGSKLVELAISPRAMKLVNHELSCEVMDAVNAAQLDHERQAKELIPITSDAEALLKTFERDLAGLQDSFTAETHDRLNRIRAVQRRWES